MIAYGHGTNLKKSFRMRFIRQYDDEDTLDELKGRSQGKGESIAEYISCCRFIASHFRTPISEKRLVSILRKRVLPEYQIYLRKEKLDKVSELIKLGKEYEEEQHQIRQYTAPKSKESMHYPEAAYVTKNAKPFGKNIDAVAATYTSPLNKNRRRRNNNDKQTEAPSMAAVAQVVNPPVGIPASVAQPTKFSYSQTVIPSDLKGAVSKSRSARSQAESTFPGQCSLCEERGHRAKDCPQKGDRLVCYSCGKLDVTTLDCPTEFCAHRRERWETDKRWGIKILVFSKNKYKFHFC